MYTLPCPIEMVDQLIITVSIPILHLFDNGFVTTHRVIELKDSFDHCNLAMSGVPACIV